MLEALNPVSGTVLIHTHGIAGVDYSSMTPDDLVEVNEAAARADMYVVPGVFLEREYLPRLRGVLERYAAEQDRYDRILGFSIEGPLLGRSGGVPPRGIWTPTARQWNEIAELGALGLRYVVIGPDGGDLDDDAGGILFHEVFDLLYAHGVRAALGHFRHDDPVRSARRTREVIDHVRARQGSAQDLVLTDHLYNDMPSNFRHAWRTAEQRARRATDLAAVMTPDWGSCDLESLLGPVPATLLQAARAGELLPFLNFDGDHVDLEVCRRTLEYLTPDNIIGITDDTPLPNLAGEALHQREGSALWYRSDGIVAAGSARWADHLRNLAGLGVDVAGHESLYRTNPRRALSPLDARVAV